MRRCRVESLCGPDAARAPGAPRADETTDEDRRLTRPANFPMQPRTSVAPDPPYTARPANRFGEAPNVEEMTNVPTILVVDDEEDSVLLLESAFRKAHFSNP